MHCENELSLCYPIHLLLSGCNTYVSRSCCTSSFSWRSYFSGRHWVCNDLELELQKRNRLKWNVLFEPMILWIWGRCCHCCSGDFSRSMFEHHEQSSIEFNNFLTQMLNSAHCSWLIQKSSFWSMGSKSPARKSGRKHHVTSMRILEPILGNQKKLSLQPWCEETVVTKLTTVHGAWLSRLC